MESSSVVQLHCPNCGKKIIGYKSADGAVRTKCPTCKVSLFSKQKSKREIDIKVISTPAAQII